MSDNSVVHNINVIVNLKSRDKGVRGRVWKMIDTSSSKRSMLASFCGGFEALITRMRSGVDA